MYYYSLYGYEENTVLQNDIKYTESEFRKICKEAPKFDMGNYESYDSSEIYKYLVVKYKFKPIEYIAGFFVDGDMHKEDK